MEIMKMATPRIGPIMTENSTYLLGKAMWIVM
jgi:hypothetical protein